MAVNPSPTGVHDREPAEKETRVGEPGAASPRVWPPLPEPYPDPQPRSHLLSRDGVPSGVVKERADDFLVEELPLYEPEGEGEHLYLGIQKRMMAHAELLRLLGRHFGVAESAIGAAGMKDRLAITRQTVSIHLPGRANEFAAASGPGSIDLGTERVAVLWAMWHRNKLRRGHLAGNRFVIRIRRIDPLAAPAIWRRLQALEKRGAPNYFGPQRFGYRGNTHRLGALLLRQDWEGVLAELLGAKGSWFPEHQRSFREAFDAGDFELAAQGWGPNDAAERIALRKFAKSRKARRAVLSAGDHARSFWVSAIQSAAYNRLLDDRLSNGTFESLREGDVAFRHEGGSSFLVSRVDLERGDLEERLARGELSPAGPLWGAKLLEASGETAARELEALAAFGVEPSMLASGPDAADGARRPYRMFPKNIELDAGTDEHGAYVRLAFDLSKGGFATTLLRELIDEQSAEPRPSGRPRDGDE